MKHVVTGPIVIISSLLIVFGGVSGIAQYPFNQEWNIQQNESLLTDSDIFSEEHLIALNAKKIYSITTADLDGDGDADVVIGSFKTDKVSWFRNNGYNDFGSKQVIGNADNIASVHASDIDGDGDIDVLTASTNDNDILLFENDGDGNFSEEQLIGNIEQAWSVSTADIDGDNDLDIVAGGLLFNMTAWFENLGAGNFGPTQVINSTEMINSPLDFFDVQIEDLDGDGDLDILTCSYDEDKISWYENSGEGEFLEEQVISNTVNGPADISTGDLDGDGDPDLICAARLDGGQLLLFENLGASGFGPKTVLSNQNESLRNIDVKDLDMDGDIDILANTSSQSTLSWYENDGSGIFDQHLLMDTPRSYSIHCSDLDGDGHLDLVTGREVGLQWNENLLPSMDCSTFQNGPVDLNKAFPIVDGVQNRVTLKFYKESPEIKYSDIDAAACDIKAWEKRNLDPETGLVIGNEIQNPDTIILIDKKKSYSTDSPRSIYKWPLKYYEDGIDNAKRVLPNKRYQWQVRCACNHGIGPESPWSMIKFFDTPDFDMSSGTYETMIPPDVIESKSMSGLEKPLLDLMVWPNPTDGLVILEFPYPLSLEVSGKGREEFEVEVFDALGRLVQGIEFGQADANESKMWTVDLHSLSEGIYTLRLISNEGQHSTRIIKE